MGLFKKDKTKEEKRIYPKAFPILITIDPNKEIKEIYPLDYPKGKMPAEKYGKFENSDMRM